jgi:DNA-binding MarR family transcriptional regulator
MVQRQPIKQQKGKTERQTDLSSLAQEVEQRLSAIRQVIRRPVIAEFAKGGLTGPQRSVMRVLVRSDGLSLKDLTARIGLSHSTVSGIVDRLERQGLAERKVNPTDRRNTTITASQIVLDFLKNDYPKLAAHPLEQALSRASQADLKVILSGIRRLHRLMTE